MILIFSVYLHLQCYCNELHQTQLTASFDLSYTGILGDPGAFHFVNYIHRNECSLTSGLPRKNMYTANSLHF